MERPYGPENNILFGPENKKKYKSVHQIFQNPYLDKIFQNLQDF